MKVANIIHHCERMGACGPALVWMEQQLIEEPEIGALEMWTRLTKLRRTKGELAYEAEMKRQEPSWRPNPDAHTGWAWIAWLCRKLGVPCSNGTASGARKVSDGPNAHLLVLALRAVENVRRRGGRLGGAYGRADLRPLLVEQRLDDVEGPRGNDHCGVQRC